MQTQWLCTIWFLQQANAVIRRDGQRKQYNADLSSFLAVASTMQQAIVAVSTHMLLAPALNTVYNYVGNCYQHLELHAVCGLQSPCATA